MLVIVILVFGMGAVIGLFIKKADEKNLSSGKQISFVMMFLAVGIFSVLYLLEPIFGIIENSFSMPRNYMVYEKGELAAFENGYFVIENKGCLEYQKKDPLYGTTRHMGYDCYPSQKEWRESTLNVSDTCTIPMFIVYKDALWWYALFGKGMESPSKIFLSIPKGTVKTISEKKGD